MGTAFIYSHQIGILAFKFIAAVCVFNREAEDLGYLSERLNVWQQCFDRCWLSARCGKRAEP
jgi:hypothetical protein